MDPSQQSRPLLHNSCLLGDEENVARLISSGVNVNEVDFAGCSAIQLACAAGYLNIVKLLLQNGAKPEIQDSTHGNTSLHESSWRGFSGLVKILCSSSTINVQNHGGFTSLHLACQAGHNQSTRELLIAGADPNLVNTYGDTPLHTSVRYGHAGVCRILLSARAEADIQNKNGDTALHISSAMHRKKLTKILLSSGCTSTLYNNQNETPLDICARKDFHDVIHVLQNPPHILTPMQRDDMRASKVKTGHHQASSKKVQVQSLPNLKKQQPSGSGAGTGTGTATLRQQMLALLSSKSGSRKSIAGNQASKSPKISSIEQVVSKSGKKSRSNHGSKNNSNSNLNDKLLHHHQTPGKRESASSKDISTKVNVNTSEEAAVVGVRVGDVGDDDELPKWSPYGCHYHPNSGSFPKPNIDSLPKEPLTTGELYYLDLAGNIHKGPMGVSEGCYCNTLLSQNQNSQSMLALNSKNNHKSNKKPSRHHNHHHHHSSKQELQAAAAEAVNKEVVIGKGTKYEDQLKCLTTQLSKIHMDTQAQLSSLHSMLNERLKDGSTTNHHDDNEVDGDGEGNEFNENKLKDWVKQYRRFRKEISKNPKTLGQANELLASASALLSTRLPSPPPDSETDSGL